MTSAPTAQNHWPLFDDDRHSFYGGWHSWAFVNDTDYRQHKIQYDDTVHWIKQHVPNWAGDAQWKKVNDCFYIRLRKEQDAILFTLKFGQSYYESV